MNMVIWNCDALDDVVFVIICHIRGFKRSGMMVYPLKTLLKLIPNTTVQNHLFLLIEVIIKCL